MLTFAFTGTLLTLLLKGIAVVLAFDPRELVVRLSIRTKRGPPPSSPSTHQRGPLSTSPSTR